MKCERCSHWTIKRITKYANGETVENWKAEPGKGLCDKLQIQTEEDFGCNKFLETDDDHIAKAWKNGAPWQHSQSGPCPDCQGNAANGGGVCRRCAGTGKVRHYDDGYIGEEQTRLHPRELETAEPLRCRGCKKEVQVEWMACPYCGTKLEPPAETVFVGDGNAGDVGPKGSSSVTAASVLAGSIEEMNEGNAALFEPKSTGI